MALTAMELESLIKENMDPLKYHCKVYFISDYRSYEPKFDVPIEISILLSETRDHESHTPTVSIENHWFLLISGQETRPYTYMFDTYGRTWSILSAPFIKIPTLKWMDYIRTLTPRLESAASDMCGEYCALFIFRLSELLKDTDETDVNLCLQEAAQLFTKEFIHDTLNVTSLLTDQQVEELFEQNDKKVRKMFKEKYRKLPS